MEQGADRGRAFHGIRQPRHKGELGAFTHNPSKHKKRAERHQSGRHPGRHIRVVHLKDVHVAEVYENQQHANEKKDIPETGHDKCLFARLGSAELFIPETDE